MIAGLLPDIAHISRKSSVCNGRPSAGTAIAVPVFTGGMHARDQPTSFLQNFIRTVIPNGIDRTIFRPQSSFC